MEEKPVWERDDVDAILKGLFDIRASLARLLAVFGDDDEGEEETDS